MSLQWSTLIDYFFDTNFCSYLKSSKYDGCPFEYDDSLPSVENVLRRRACECASAPSKMQLSPRVIAEAHYSVAAAIISQGAVLGKVAPQQLFLIGLMLIVVQRFNRFIGIDIIGAVDNVGSGLTVHVFSAFFGLGCAAVLSRSGYGKNPDNTYRFVLAPITSTSLTPPLRRYQSGIYSCVGSLIMFFVFPTFNSFQVAPSIQQIVVVNTVLALIGSTVGAFAFGAIFTHGRLNVVELQHLFLAGPPPPIPRTPPSQPTQAAPLSPLQEARCTPPHFLLF